MRAVFRIGFLVGILLTSGLQGQRGALVKTRNLDELTAEADKIVQGSVVSARVEPHPRYHHLSTVVVTFAVKDVLKGTAAKNITFRQFIWDIRDKQSNGGYVKGQHFLLFLKNENAEGFSGTAGLNQGRMLVRDSPDGTNYVQSSVPNADLLAGVMDKLETHKKVVGRSLRTAVRSPDSPLELNDFKRAVRDLTAIRRSK